MKNKILISALEPSANLHLKKVLDELGEYDIKGIFSPKFGEPFMSSDEFSAMGFVEVLPLIFKAKIAIKKMVSLAKECEHILLIDSPAFNLPLAKALKEANIIAPITYYILPQVWAWKQKRVKKVEKYCDNLASILPFDKEYYNRSIYVGHPLLDIIDKTKTDYSRNKVLSFLPGSRRAEISKLMPIFNELIKNYKDYKKQLVVPPHLKDKIAQFYGDVSEYEILFDTKEALLKSEFAFVCSGTATLEAALVGTPFVLCYQAKKIDMFIAKLFVKNIKYVGLANIIFTFSGKKPLHKELLQDDVNVENLLKAHRNCNYKEFVSSAKELRQYLKFGSAKNVANLIKG